MKRTKIMSLLLATAMSASLIACGSASGSNSSNSSSSDNTNSSSSTESSSTESVSKDSGSVGNSEKLSYGSTASRLTAQQESLIWQP